MSTHDRYGPHEATEPLGGFIEHARLMVKYSKNFIKPDPNGMYVEPGSYPREASVAFRQR